VLERYIGMATENGVTQALYPEGGLTRDGKMREPKLGVLDYMLRGFHPDGPRDLVFVPLGINYDRTLEDRTLLLALDPGARRPGLARAAWNTAGFVLHQACLVVKSRWQRFGYACVNFGTPISMREYCAANRVDFGKLSKDERSPHVANLGRHLMSAVGKLIPVLPVPLVATVFCDAPERRFSTIELKAEVESRVARLERAGAHVYVPRSELDGAVALGLEMLALRRLIAEEDGWYRALPSETKMLRYYANSIAHLF
jgi:glycerol-3-phosphate O-acyltransferase